MHETELPETTYTDCRYGPPGKSRRANAHHGQRQASRHRDEGRWLGHKGSVRLGVRLQLFVCWLLNVPATLRVVSQGRICSDNLTCCHTEVEAADQTFYLTQSQYTDTGPNSPSTGGQRDRQTDRETDRQTGRQTGRQTDRQAGRQAGKQKQKPRPTQRDIFRWREPTDFQ